MRQVLEEYRGLIKRRSIVMVSLVIMLLLLTLFSISIGSMSLSLGKVVEVLTLIFLSSSRRMDPSLVRIIINLRLPRIIMAIIAGACLGVAGTILQITLRNPLASPYTIGVTSSAAFGAALAIILGAGVIGWMGKNIIYTNPYVVVFNAFTFSAMCSIIVAFLSLYKGTSPSATILAGIAMTYLFSAATSLLQYFGTTEQIAALVFWVFGDLGKAEWLDVSITSCIFLITLPLIMWLTGDYNALISSDEVAESLGVNVKTVRIISLIMASLLTATPIAFVGTISFIGLLAPHIARLIIGSDHRYLVPTSALIGAILLLAADTAGRTVLSPLILPVGILTAFMGVPLFLYLLLKRREGYL